MFIRMRQWHLRCPVSTLRSEQRRAADRHDVLRRAHAVATATRSRDGKPSMCHIDGTEASLDLEQGVAVSIEPYRVMVLPYQFVNESGMPWRRSKRLCSCMTV